MARRRLTAFVRRLPFARLTLPLPTARVFLWRMRRAAPVRLGPTPRPLALVGGAGGAYPVVQAPLPAAHQAIAQPHRLPLSLATATACSMACAMAVSRCEAMRPRSSSVMRGPLARLCSEWREAGDSNPGNLAVLLFSRQAHSSAMRASRFAWRMGRDSNPRSLAAHRTSKPAHSPAIRPIRICRA